MSAQTASVDDTFSKVLNFVYKRILSKTTIGRDLTQGESKRLHRLLCAYVVHYGDPSVPLPPDVIDASDNLTEEERADLTVLGEIGNECKEIERALDAEWAALPAEAKKILKSRAQNGSQKIKAFSEGMPLWQSLMWGTITSAGIAWDLWTASTGPDTSLLPRIVGFSAGTASAALGFLIAPGANFRQFFEVIFQDRTILGIPQRIVYTTAIKRPEFYENRTLYIPTVGSSAVTLLLLLTLPEPIKNKMEDRIMDKIGAMPPPEDEIEEHTTMAASIRSKAEVIEQLQKKLKKLASRHVLGQGTSDHISRLSSRTHRLSNLLLRTVGEYVEVKHDEHGKKLAIVAFWNAIIAAMLGAARKNPGQIGVLIPYIVFSERRMLEILFDSSRGSEEMVSLFTRSGATALYQLFFISVPLLIHGPKTFDEPKFKGWITGALAFINTMVIHYTPDAILLISDKSRAAFRWNENGIRSRRQRVAAQEDEDAGDIFFDALAGSDDEAGSDNEVYSDAFAEFIAAIENDGDEADDVYADALAELLDLNVPEEEDAEEFFDARSEPIAEGGAL